MTILGHLFSLLPLGPLPFRVNLLSLVGGIAAVGLVYLTALRLTGVVVAAAAAALTLGLSTLFWEWALAAEVFQANNALTAAMIYLLVRWRERPERGGWLIAAALATGLGLSNQLTIVLLAPAVSTVLWSRRAALTPALVAACAFAILLGLLPYAYIPWAAARHPVVNWGAATTLSDLVDLFLRRDYGTGRLVAGPYAGGSAHLRLQALFASFGPLMGVLLIAGAVQAYRSRRWYFWFCLLAFLFAGPVFIAYANMDVSKPQAHYVLERFFLLPRVALAPLLAFGVLLLADGLARAWPRIGARATRATALAVITAAGVAAARNYAEIDQRDNVVARVFGEDILATLEPNSLLLAGGDHAVLPLVYLQAVEKLRPDVTLVMLPLLNGEWYVRELRQRHPDLVLPFARHSDGAPTMKALVTSNAHRPIALVGDVLDHSLKGAFWFYRYGLVYQLLPMNRDIPISQMARDNEALLARYRPPSAHAIKAKSFEYGILLDYAAPALKLGQEYEKGGRLVEARLWYERALAVSNDLELAREGLARVAALESARNVQSAPVREPPPIVIRGAE